MHAELLRRDSEAFLADRRARRWRAAFLWLLSGILGAAWLGLMAWIILTPHVLAWIP